MLNLIVKGGRFEAARAAANRAIPAAFKMEGRSITVLSVGSQYIDEVLRWYSEVEEVIPNYGFPAGTLLLVWGGGAGDGPGGER